MKVYDHISAACELAKATNKPVLFLSFNIEDNQFSEDWNKAAPYLDFQDNKTSQAVFDGQAIIICDSDAERDKLYALTIDRTGQTLNENT